MVAEVDVRFFETATSKWRSKKTGAYYPDPPPTGLGLLGYVVYTPAEIAAWSTGTQFSALVTALNTGNDPSNNAWGGTSRTIQAQGSTFTGLVGSGNKFRDDCMFAKAMAVRWAVDGDTTVRNKVIEVLTQASNITSIPACASTTASNAGQIRLELSWAVANLLQAAAIIGWTSPGFENFLRLVYPGMQWRTSSNWHASFAEVMLGIAAFLDDEVLWADAIDNFSWYIERSLHHPIYDGSSVKTLPSVYWSDPTVKTAPTNANVMNQHWWSAYPTSATSWPASYSGWTFEPGTDAELRRDPDHAAMSVTGWFNAARTIKANGQTVPAHAHQRLKEYARFLSKRVLYYDINKPSQLPGIPVWAGTIGAYVWRTSWYLIEAYLGAETPADVITLQGRTSVQTTNAVGYNYLAAERMAEGSLVA